MSLDVSKREIAPEELLAMPDAAGFELVDGELVERNVSVLSSFVEGLIFSILSAYSQSSKAVLVWPGTLGYQCFPDAPKKVRKPDASAVLTQRFADKHFKEGFLTIRPDLAVEVVSPNDTAYEIAEKIEEYVNIQVPLVWVVYPENRLLEIHRPDGSVRKLHVDAELTGDNVLPDFRCPVRSFFPAT